MRTMFSNTVLPIQDTSSVRNTKAKMLNASDMS